MRILAATFARLGRFVGTHGWILRDFARRHAFDLAVQLAVSTASIAAQGALLAAGLQFLKRHSSGGAATTTGDIGAGAATTLAPGIAAEVGATAQSTPSLLLWGLLLLAIGAIACWLDTLAAKLSLRLGRMHAREVFDHAPAALAALTEATIPEESRRQGPESHLARVLVEAETMLMRYWSIVLDAVGPILLVPLAFVLLARTDIQAAAVLLVLIGCFGVVLYLMNLRVVTAARGLAKATPIHSAQLKAVAGLVVSLRATESGPLIRTSITASKRGSELERLLTLRRAVGALRHPFTAAFLALMLTQIAVGGDQGPAVWARALTVVVTAQWITSGLQRFAATVTYMTRVLPQVARVVATARSERACKDSDGRQPSLRWRSSALLADSVNELEVTADGSTALCWCGRGRPSADRISASLSIASGRRVSPLAIALATRGASWLSLDEQSLLGAFPPTERNRQRHAHWVASHPSERDAPQSRLLLGALLADRPILLVSDVVLRTANPETVRLLHDSGNQLFLLIDPSRPAPGDAARIAVLDETGVIGLGSRSWFESVRPSLKSRLGADVAIDPEDDTVDDDE